MGFVRDLMTARSVQTVEREPSEVLTAADRSRARAVAEEVAKGDAWLQKIGEAAYLLVVDALVRDGDWQKTVPWLADMVMFGKAQVDDEAAATAAAAVSTVAMIAALEDLVPEASPDAAEALIAQTSRRLELAVSV